MKRKNGHKKGNSKKIKLIESGIDVLSNRDEVISLNSDDFSGSDDEDNDNDDDVAENQPGSVPGSVNVQALAESTVKVVRPPPTVVYGRVKVKLKASGSNSNPKPPSELPVGPTGGEGSVGEKVEKGVVGGGGIKIVSWSKGVSPNGRRESGSGSGGSGSDEKKKVVVVKEEDRRKEVEANVRRDGDLVRFNKHELVTSLEVIRKIMRMDAAEPFNVPVNPVELGIPDYFDVIDTPMDFGTVCKNLESGGKYMNSEDVFKDVQYIWNNCFKYNNKGDYIVDLMRRVKKNFMKYWMAAGLYTESTKKANGGEGSPMDEATSSGYDKKFKKGKGFKRHKDGCMCAICIMRRRRKEREVREAREAGFQVGSPQLEVTMMDLTREIKQEENSHAESPRGEDTSSYMETSPDVDADAETERAEEMRHVGVTPQHDDEQHAEDSRLEFRDRPGDISQKHQRNDRGEVETYSDAETKVRDESGSKIKIDIQKQLSVEPEGQTSTYLRQKHEQLELEKKRQRLRLIETFCDLENPMLLGLCGTLFPNKPQSVWNRANSLVRHQNTTHKSDIHEAIASFMTPYKSSSSQSRN